MRYELEFFLWMGGQTQRKCFVMRGSFDIMMKHTPNGESMFQQYQILDEMIDHTPSCTSMIQRLCTRAYRIVYQLTNCFPHR